MEQNILLSVGCGMLGGLLRGILGIVKHFESKESEKKIRWGYFSLTVGLSAVIGGIAGSMTEGNWRFAFAAGYGGIDFLEGLYKLKRKEAIGTLSLLF
jgi:hypothetical protein